MTRLTENDLAGIDQSLQEHDLELLQITGLTLRRIACQAAGASEDQFDLLRMKTAVIPITAGEGIISNFANSVRSIISYLGYPAYVTAHRDISGIHEAITGGAELLFMADDQRFIAFNVVTKSVVDNGAATARGYVTALNNMCGGLCGQNVLVIGAGEVGSVAISTLKEIGAKAAVHDIDPLKVRNLEKTDVQVLTDLRNELPKFKYIVDASPQAAFLDLADLHPEVMIAAPGIPLGLTTNTYAALQGRVVHDPLEIGVAVMLAMAII
ncbi:3-methylornithyl-N6-L-lysine dehydrogenase PylD [Desulfosporosinus sp. FKB]|uniref:3-methylornithyl-N6-L-lysine dehydrogenase PylD n=1 Tax=Desulfosporosinus sp. FKB TaxID=1969835 RepID=UPI000B497AA7|nr:3-methylornithyl-N6-L-lysine dehydrogenase PylD [Desulfosporosinus sp. FKB]